MAGVYKSKSEISHEAWLQWMEEVPPEVRGRVADTIRSVDLSRPDGFIKLSQELMAQVLEGNIPQSISSDLRAWAGVITEHLQASGPKDAGLAGQINMIIDQRSNVPHVLDSLPNYDKALERIPAKKEKTRGK